MIVTQTPPQPPGPDRQSQLQDASVRLEAAFLSVMLKSAGLGDAMGGPGAGTGQDHYGALLADLQATELARGGGIGLAEQIFDALMEREADAGFR